MEITYIGHSCFKIKGKDLTLVIDPYEEKKVGYKLPKLKADIVLSTHPHANHNHIKGVSEHSLIVDKAGEYEKSDVFIDGIETFHDAAGGQDKGKNIIYQIEIDGFKLLHLGDLGHELAKHTLEQLLEIDVVMLPVGGAYTIDAKAANKVIASVEPSIVIPMHYKTDDLEESLSKELAPVKKFLDEVGSDKVSEKDSLKLSKRSDVPEEMEIVVLKPAH